MNKNETADTNTNDAEKNNENVERHVSCGEVRIKGRHRYKGPVDILESGWIFLIDVNEYYPPNKVSQVWALPENERPTEWEGISKEDISWPYIIIGAATIIGTLYIFITQFGTIVHTFDLLYSLLIIGAMMLIATIGSTLIMMGIEPEKRENLAESEKTA